MSTTSKDKEMGVNHFSMWNLKWSDLPHSTVNVKGLMIISTYRKEYITDIIHKEKDTSRTNKEINKKKTQQVENLTMNST